MLFTYYVGTDNMSKLKTNLFIIVILYVLFILKIILKKLKN